MRALALVIGLFLAALAIVLAGNGPDRSEPSWRTLPGYRGPPVHLDMGRGYKAWCPFILVFAVPGPGFTAELDDIRKEGSTAVIRATLRIPLEAASGPATDVEVAVNALDPAFHGQSVRGNAIEMRLVQPGQTDDAVPFVRACVREW